MYIELENEFQTRDQVLHPACHKHSTGCQHFGVASNPSFPFCLAALEKIFAARQSPERKAWVRG